jgi:hypothetical protein
MESIYKVRTNKRKNRSLDISFFQDSPSPVQMLKSNDELYLPLVEGQKLVIDITNNSNNYVGVTINNGFYNLIIGQPVNPSHSYENALFEIQPRGKILIRERYSNAYSKENPTPLIITKDHFQNLLVVYTKSGYEEFIGADQEESFISYNNRAKKVLSVRIINQNQIS